MRGFFQQFMKSGNLLTFLVLEAICFALIVRYNQPQDVIFEHTVNLYAGTLQKKRAELASYLELKKINDSLMAENARLLQRLYDLETSMMDSVPPLEDSLYVVEPVKVVSNTVIFRNNYLVLNKGSTHGIRPHSGVITSNGVAGIVRRVSPNSAVAMSALHGQFRVASRIRNKGNIGTLVWSGKSPWEFQLQDVSKDATVIEGDTVETSGFSDIFPPGLMLGTVEKVTLEPGSNFYSIKVRYSLDLSRLNYAYVITSLLKKEREENLAAVRKEDE